ncbi:hypothetical protein Ab1vBOLIVR5_gp15 [Agrobacterium phage OLIVR5]|uniref:Uncharacterized protein n=1 Tax=Agrobacterium phage OLIVR5 TaxID=2723773 RepID=A0A858MT05_9CAUD|nr:hypothetical protein KNU99_gp015 [Agrobacterium phage OLIVR5]QIW87663.1 hypothetical protein Ab1vBOLIVR5_gp15 [Agrobacterium phage OLIVR5]QIW87922.1 hypothetical protein Ab1vBOLIVR6_gp15 [Agrobacterium phage OLIVR6]
MKFFSLFKKENILPAKTVEGRKTNAISLEAMLQDFIVVEIDGELYTSKLLVRSEGENYDTFHIRKIQENGLPCLDGEFLVAYEKGDMVKFRNRYSYHDNEVFISVPDQSVQDDFWNSLKVVFVTTNPNAIWTEINVSHVGKQNMIYNITSLEMGSKKPIVVDRKDGVNTFIVYEQIEAFTYKGNRK